jgi:hypothetical protein
VRLDRLLPGFVRDVSSDLAAWLVAERYADVEMRHDVRTTDEEFLDMKNAQPAPTNPDTPRRRSGDY